MNEHLSERFGRSRKAHRHDHRPQQAEVWILPPKLNTRIREYFEQKLDATSPWLARPEFPTSDEVLDRDDSSASAGEIVEIPTNKPQGAFDNTDDYLSTQYQLLREDAIRGIREAVGKIRHTPQATEDSFSGQIGIYEKVHICGVIASTRGVAARITFSLARVGKQILWEQSKRLITGSVVVLTPVNDMFNSKAIVATVAARPLQRVHQNPPEIDIFFADTDEMEIDPAQEFVMVEARSSFYEAARPTLLALQHMSKESFPLSEHLVDVKREVGTPQYILNQPMKDLTSVLINKHETYENVDLRKWPAEAESELDKSQLQALRRILTKRLAIVQGPPGTGKTHVSVQAIKVMLDNRRKDDPPIIIACQTNHAIDQILRHIAKFEPDYVRLGGRSKDAIIKKRTLYEVRQEVQEDPLAGCMFGMAKNKIRDMEKEIQLVLEPLRPDKVPMLLNTLKQFNILSEAQVDSLEAGAEQWVQTKDSVGNDRSPFVVWLGDKLVSVPHKQEAEEFGFDFEEVDLEFEMIKETEAENAAKEDEDALENLNGPYLPLADNFTCRPVPGGDAKARDLLRQQDMWKIPEAYRPSVYRYLQTELKKHLTTGIRDLSKRFNQQVVKRRIGYWEKDENVLKRQKIIGCTTTGFSKYRALLSAMQPKVILIEEAAETLEAPVAVACIPSLQNLILVGDHQQLRPHTQVRAHEDKPYFLNVSLFERLVNNGIEFDTLQKQRRMAPEIRRLLFPIYQDKISDHPSVRNPDVRPDVRGMGGVNSYFFSHQWPESKDDQMSSLNTDEADMVTSFFVHLVYNGLDVEEITVLTFYNGQRKRILKDLCGRFGTRKYNVVTVDSYQGEENKVVLLSLVRSNDNKQIGFLNVVNRVCVALSRAQCGFYIFGNGKLLFENSQTWSSVIQIMAGKKEKDTRAIRADIPKVRPARLGGTLPIQCTKHNRVLELACPDDFEKLHGGCNQPCGGVLPCGHKCTLLCHPVSHDLVNCSKCRPKDANKAPVTAADENQPGETDPPTAATRSSSKSSASKSTDSWNDFAREEQKRVSEQMAAYKHVPKEENTADLIDFGDDEDNVKGVQQLSLGMDGTTERPGKATKATGGRKKWTEKYVVGTKDWSNETSLLDKEE